MRVLWILAYAGCGELTFECGGKALSSVPLGAVCDGVVDCWGGQDERGDDCSTELYYCDDPEPQALLAAQACDGVADCNTEIDEADCGS